MGPLSYVNNSIKGSENYEDTFIVKIVHNIICFHNTLLQITDIGTMRSSDISFALILVLHAMSPPNVKSALSGGQNLKTATEIRTGSLTFTGTRDTKTLTKINSSLYQVAFLGKC